MGLERTVDYEVETREVERELWFCDSCGSGETEERYVVFGGTVDESGDVAVEGGEDRCHICFTFDAIQDHHARLLKQRPEGYTPRAIGSEEREYFTTHDMNKRLAKALIVSLILAFFLLVLFI